MTQQLHEHRAEVLRHIAAAPYLFCFFDYDGTLAPIAPTPGEAKPLAGTTHLLEALATAADTEVALITGRAIADLRRFVDIDALHYIGIHGLETQRPGEPPQMAASAAAITPLIPEIRRQVEARISGLAGVFLEDKGVAIACHYRLASRPDARAARDAVVAVVRSYEDRAVPLAYIDGHEVTEIRPRGANKGEAVAALLATRPTPLLALYVGDDRTDEDAFERLTADAITIHVGGPEQKTAARYRVADPVEVQVFLLDVLAARQ